MKEHTKTKRIIWQGEWPEKEKAEEKKDQESY